MKRLRAVAFPATAALLAIAAPARANDPATATMLFEEGRRLVGAGHYADACPKFEESERLDPGLGTQFHLADCYEHTGRLASAWALFLDVSSAAGGTGQEAREALARKRAAALEPRLSKLTIAVPRPVEGVEVHRNGEALAEVLWNAAVPVDPGSYRVEASAPGHKTWVTVATVASEGAATTVTVPPLEPEAPATAPSPALAAAPPPVSPDDDAARRTQTEKLVAIAAGGAGVVGIALGAGFGIDSISKHGAYERYCAGDTCQPGARSLHDAAVSSGNASTVSFVVGGVLLAGAGVLWYVAGRTAPPLTVAPAVGASAGGATVTGVW